MREQLESVWRQTGVRPKELDEIVQLPESCYQVWKFFIDLHNARSSNGFGVNPINYTEIKSYFDLMSIVPEEWEVNLIRRFDMEALSAYAKEAEREQKKSNSRKN